MSATTKFDEFLIAQDAVYDAVLRELTAGRKRTHWMWFIFPQLLGLGASWMSQRFGLASQAEACNYLQHAILGPRLIECTQLMLAVENRDILSILGEPDDRKFRSSMTLFAIAAPELEWFDEALHKYFAGERDALTLALLRNKSDANRESTR